MKSRIVTQDALRLLLDGSIALASIEHNGIKIDEEYLANTIEKVSRKITHLGRELQENEVWNSWKKKYGDKANLGSRPQLGDILFNEMGLDYPSEFKTATGRYSTDDSVLAKVKHNFVKQYLQIAKLEKLKNTYLKGVSREICDGYLHPSYNLHTARTYRSSAQNPSFQNIPIRDPKIGKLIRKCFIPRNPKRHLVEIDFSKAEVKVSCAYHKDPVLIEYETDPDKDMHRDMAMRLFFLKQEQVTKAIRYAAKGAFVFAQFYGDWYKHCAKGLWEAMNLETTDGKKIKDVLAENGIRQLGPCDPNTPAKEGTFEHHVMKEENHFWNNRFKVYKEWKNQWWKDYLDKGWFKTLTGFVVEAVSGKGGMLSRNDVVNYPIQGSSFHCLLWVLIKVQRWLTKNKMKTKLVGQIHDSLLGDVHPDELQDYLSKVWEVVTVDLRKAWDWLIVPMECECEVSPAGLSWWDKQKWELSNGLWKVAV